MEFLRAKDIAESLGVSTGRVYQLAAANKVPYIRDGRSIKFPRQAWENWVKTQNETASAMVRTCKDVD